MLQFAKQSQSVAAKGKAISPSEGILQKAFSSLLFPPCQAGINSTPQP
jgi:hypothetical protein